MARRNMRGVMQVETRSEAESLDPDQVIAQLRALVEQIPDVPSLSDRQRVFLRKNGTMPDAEVQASIGLISISDKVEQTIEVSADEVRQMVDKSNRWMGVETEVKVLLQAIRDANLVRRHSVEVIAIQAYAIALQLARDPENALIEPYLDTIRRLKAVRRRRRMKTTEPTEANEATPEPLEHDALS